MISPIQAEAPPPEEARIAAVAPPPPARPPRVVSIDALRGFIMFWIVGGDKFIATLPKAMPGAVSQFLSKQFTHSPWEGVYFYDLVFPTFVFIVGVSLVFSLSRTLAEAGPSAVVKRLLYRSAILYLLGLFVYGGLSAGWDHVRWVGVLQRIGICYLCCGLIFSFCKWRSMLAIFVVLLAGYWAAMTFIPIRNFNLEKQHLEKAWEDAGTYDTWQLFQQASDHVSGRFEEGLNVANHFDFQYLPGRKWDGAYDPEGVLSTAPAIATCLFGVFAGMLLRSGGMSEQRKVYLLLAVGTISVCLGYLWGWQFPVVKKLWTSSFVLVVGGYACVLLAVFHQLIDLWGWRKWCTPFLWLGMNSIAIYVICLVTDFYHLAERIVGGPVKASLGEWGNSLVAATVLAMVLSIVRFFYRRNIFIKL